MEAPILRRGVPPGAQGRNDRGVRRWAAYPQALQLLDQAGLRVARRGLGEVLAGDDLFDRHAVALVQGRDRLQAVQRLGVFLLIRLAVDGMIAVEYLARTGGPEQEAAFCQLEIDLGRFVDCWRHLRRHEPAPNELIQLEEIALQVLLEVL